jgi:hypothetical protein
MMPAAAAPLLDRAAEPAQGGREQPLSSGSAAGARAARSAGSSTRPTTGWSTCSGTSVIGFDTTEFLDLPEVRTPVMMYLLQVMEELVNGERLIYVISEFWKALDHEIFSDFAKQKQKTIRKQNGLGIFDTQSPSDVLRHPIGRTMVEQSVTKIFLANPEAVREEYVDGFGLSEAEFDIVRSLGAQGGRRFLVKQGHASAICELDLAGTRRLHHRALGDHRQRALLDGIRERHGDDPFQWLPVAAARGSGSQGPGTRGEQHEAVRHLHREHCSPRPRRRQAQFVKGNEAVKVMPDGTRRSRRHRCRRPGPFAPRSPALQRRQLPWRRLADGRDADGLARVHRGLRAAGHLPASTYGNTKLSRLWVVKSRRHLAAVPVPRPGQQVREHVRASAREPAVPAVAQ